jgi:hypothetical protein
MVHKWRRFAGMLGSLALVTACGVGTLPDEEVQKAHSTKLGQVLESWGYRAVGKRDPGNFNTEFIHEPYWSFYHNRQEICAHKAATPEPCYSMASSVYVTQASPARVLGLSTNKLACAMPAAAARFVWLTEQQQLEFLLAPGQLRRKLHDMPGNPKSPYRFDAKDAPGGVDWVCYHRAS